MAMVSLPKEQNYLDCSYKLAQSSDKKAQLAVKLRIKPFDSTLASKDQLSLNPEFNNGKLNGVVTPVNDETERPKK